MKNDFTPEENAHITQIAEAISIMLMFNNVKPHHGIIALSELIIVVFADKAKNSNVPAEEVKEKYTQYIESLKVQGCALIDMAAKLKKDLTKNLTKDCDCDACKVKREQPKKEAADPLLDAFLNTNQTKH